MDYWRGILKVPLAPSSTSCYKVAVSLCLSSTSKALTVPSANAIFFLGDRVEGTRNPVIERLSDPQKIAEILVSKFGGCVNAWVIEAPIFNGPFAVYRDFIPSVNRYGEPKSYSPAGFPASTSVVSLLSNCLEEAKNVIFGTEKELFSNITAASPFYPPKICILGFSKGGTVLNQLLNELSVAEVKSQTRHQSGSGGISEGEEKIQIIPDTKEILLNSISEVHYVDCGLNSAGAYITDQDVVRRISERLMEGGPKIQFVLHGTPRQWCDSGRIWIRDEKDELIRLLEYESQRSGGKLLVREKFYFGNSSPNLQMHFEIIESMDVN